MGQYERVLDDIFRGIIVKIKVKFYHVCEWMTITKQCEI
jgi:hypothetical protein